MRAHLLIPLLLISTPALAQSGGGEPICAGRPGLGTPPCVTPSGRVVGELGVVSWTLSKDGVERTDTLIAGDSLARIGTGGGAEVQVGWTAFGSVRERTADGIVRESGVGDVMVGVLKGIVDGDVLALSVLARATLPTGGEAIGAGDWSASLIVPAEIAIDRTFSLELTPSVAATADEDRRGRHLNYGLVAGVGADFDAAIAAIEIGVERDQDPSGTTTPVLLGLSVGWRPDPDLQLDAGANLGLDDEADDMQLYIGISRRF